MRLILSATRPDRINDGAANFRVYLKPGCEENRGVRKKKSPGGHFSKQEEWLLTAFCLRTLRGHWLAECQLNERILIGVRLWEDGPCAPVEWRRLRQTRAVFRSNRQHIDAAVSDALATARGSGGRLPWQGS